MSFEGRKGLRLDLGCGGNKQNGFIGLDVRELPGVDIVHNIESFPWPVENESCVVVIASHLVEHIKPEFSIPFMDECWRVLEPFGELLIATPYPGSRGFWQDPTHCNGWNEATFQYFDPTYPLFGIYKPKPWSIKQGFPTWQPQGNLEVVLTKISIEAVEEKLALATNTLGITVADETTTGEALQ